MRIPLRINVRILIVVLTAVAAAIVFTSASASARVEVLPNDPFFERQWVDLNAGQLVPVPPSEEATVAGTVGDDDGAAAAWRVSTGGSSTVVAEVDTGVDYNHPDMAANIWTNPGGIGGCLAGTHGYDVLDKQCEPMDEDTTYKGHGTHVAGILGAVGDNGIGVAGVDWHTSILPVKWLESAGNETTGLLAALEWVLRVKQEGVDVRVVNDSDTFPGTAYSEALSNEIDTLGANGILFVTAAGNTGQNNDELAMRRYPCGYDRPTEICVTASDDNDELPTWANYGPHTVDLAAPGVSIYSTLRNEAYGYLTGGSMAAAAVSGAAALILSVEPSLSPEQLKSRILESVTPAPGLAEKVISGGTLDICRAMPRCEGETEKPPTQPTGSSPPGAAPAPPPSVPSIAAPSIDVPVLLPPRFAVRARHRAGTGEKIQSSGGTRIVYEDSAAARTVFAFWFARTGVAAAGGRCQEMRGMRVRGARACTLWVEVGTLVHADRAGRNVVAFSGRLGGRALAPGRYRLTLTPVYDSRRGRPREASFTVVSSRPA
jgi:subtilisin family serine protease